MTQRRWTRWLLMAICLALIACDSEDIGNSGSGDGDGSPTGESFATPTTPASPVPETSIGDLETLAWQLTEIDGTPVPGTSIVTLTFIADNPNLVDGYTDCHSYMAGIEWDETSIRISESGPFAGIDVTERVCQNPDDGPAQDEAFYAALSETAGYVASDERLVLSDGDGIQRLVFVPRPVVAVDPALMGTTWLLTGLSGASLLPGTTITLSFDEFFAGGNDGCNEYGSQLLAASDGRLTFGNGSETEMACLTPEGVMEQADRYAEALFSAVSYRVDGNQLELMGHDGATILLFVRVEDIAFDANLATHRWGLIEANGQPAIPSSLVTLELAEGSISGSDGCNFYGGELLYANYGTLDVATPGFVQTAAGCPAEDFLPQAELVTGLLRDATWYQIDGDRLTIGDAAGNTLIFGPQADMLLIGSSWTVPMLYTELPDGEVRGDALIEGTEITLNFGEDGTIRGSAGCNSYRGNYTLTGASITIDLIEVTAMACADPPGVMEQEMTYLDTLQDVTTWEIGMNGLTLTTDDGRALRELNVVSP